MKLEDNILQEIIHTNDYFYYVMCEDRKKQMTEYLIDIGNILLECVYLTL